MPWPPRPGAAPELRTARRRGDSASQHGRRLVSENSLPGDPHWEIRHLGAANAIMGYAGAASVLTGQSFPLFVSTTSAGFRVRAFRLGWYGGDGARQVWQSGSLRGHRQNAPGLTGSTNTVQTEWDPVVEVPTDDWPAGAYLLRLDADSGAQRYVPVTVRSASTAGKIVLKAAVATWQAYNTWGGYDLYIGPGQSYAQSVAGGQPGPAVRPERRGHVPHLRAEHGQAGRVPGPAAGLRRPAWTSTTDPHLLDGASALISRGHDEYWTRPNAPT